MHDRPRPSPPDLEFPFRFCFWLEQPDKITFSELVHWTAVQLLFKTQLPCCLCSCLVQSCSPRSSSVSYNV